MKKIIMLCLSIFFTLQAMSQKKTDAMLFGDVKSAVSKEHIPFATVTVKGTRIGTVADGSGHYKLANLPVGKCIVIVRSLGYKSQEKEVIMKEGEAATLFFELKEDVL